MSATPYLSLVPQHWVLFCAILNLCIFIQCVPANLFIIAFYRKKRDKIVPLLYMLIALIDFTTGILALFHTIALFSIFFNNLSWLEYYLAMVFFLTSDTIRISAFLNTCLAVIRTINIIKPFKSINRTALKISILAYSFLWVPLIVHQEYKTYTRNDTDLAITALLYMPFVGESVIMSATGNYDPSKSIIFFTSGLPFILPSLISLVCLCIKAHALLKKRKFNIKRQRLTSDSHRDITITIAMITLLFFASNSAYTLFLTLTYISPIKVFTTNYLTGCYITSTICPFVNSAFNPVILIWRGAALRLYAGEKLVKCGITRLVLRCFGDHNLDASSVLQNPLTHNIRTVTSNLGSDRPNNEIRLRSLEIERTNINPVDETVEDLNSILHSAHRD